MKLTSDQFAILHNLAGDYEKIHNQRKGQAYLNALWKLCQHHPDMQGNIYHRIFRTDMDPFYDDKKLPKFFEFLYTPFNFEDLE